MREKLFTLSRPQREDMWRRFKQTGDRRIAINKLALWKPPYIVDDNRPPVPQECPTDATQGFCTRWRGKVRLKPIQLGQNSLGRLRGCAHLGRLLYDREHRPVRVAQHGHPPE